jgi:hypothetical protein
MSGDDQPSLELKLARAAYAEAEQLKRAAERDLEAARYERGQAEHRLRTMEQLEASITRREQRLRELGEDALLAREKAAAAKLKEAQELMKDYSSDKHSAARALNEINERERREKSERAA